MTRSDFEEAAEFARSLPDSIFLHPYTFKPMMSRNEWEHLPRWRRIFDLIFGGYPPKEDEY